MRHVHDTSTHAEVAFRAMGTSCRVLVYGDAAAELAELGRRRVELLEERWSRFRPDSELNRLCARAGDGPVEVSSDLATLVAVMREAWEWTDGLFDPTVLRAMCDLGYDADFATVVARQAVNCVVPTPCPGMAEVDVFIQDEADRGLVTLPAGVGIDPGALGKGLAADIVVDELMSAGPRGVLVDLGGDIVLAGAPDDDAWSIAIADERRSGVLDVFTWMPPVSHLAVATSSTMRRRWADGRHHVIDPRTGDVARGDLAQATVVAAQGWQAEAAATCALILGSEAGTAWLDERELDHLLTTITDEDKAA